MKLLDRRRERKAELKQISDARWCQVMGKHAPPRPRKDGKPAHQFLSGISTWFIDRIPGAEEQRIYGFYSFVRPTDGDWFITQHASGRNGLWVMSNVDIPMDPGDQFFATVRWWGYHDELRDDG
jgi:hypothetical protein